MALIANKNERVTCPFDPVHVIERSRLQTHILKCKRNLPANHDFVQCQFWGVHYVRRGNLNEHYQTCEHALMKQANIRVVSSSTSRFREPPLIPDKSVSTTFDDSWDIPSDQTPFSPDLISANSSTMVIPPGLSKAKRKECQENERKRLRQLEETKKLHQPATSWDSEVPQNSHTPDYTNVKSRNPETGNLASALTPSSGYSLNESFGAESSISRSTNSCGSDAYHSIRPNAPPPSWGRGADRASPYSVPPPSARGKGYSRMPAWDADSKPSYYPHPYDSIPYKYSPNEFPEL